MQKYFEMLKERLEEKMNHSFNQRYKAFAESIAIVNQVAEECKDRIFINGQCCWQSCACTEKCQECNRYTLSDADIDWYESIEAWYDEFGKDTNVPSNDGWIPCSERLPEERDWYLAVFQEPDTGFIGLPYIADYLLGAHTNYTTNEGWIIKDCTDHDGACEYYKDLLCVAWQPLPPYKPKGE